MQQVLEIIGTWSGRISGSLWQVFLPILVITGLYVGYKTLFMIKKQTTTKEAPMTFRQFVGPTSISLGAMIGTGAIIGVLGSLNNLVGQGQMKIESLTLWTLIGAVILVPLSYAETLSSKIMGKPPKQYISELLSPKFGALYAICFVVLYIFGFGGFQFSGIGSVISICGNEFFDIQLSVAQRYMFIVLPLIVVTGAIVMTKKHELFINSMAVMIGVAVSAYFVFFIVFISKTSSHWSVFISNMFEGMKDPITMLMGVPLGFMLALQRIIQTTESGIGGLPMAAHENDSKPRTAGAISIIPVIITIFVAVIVTSYITSYGFVNGIIQLPANDYDRLAGFFQSAVSVTGNFGLVVLVIFCVFSGITTLLGSYYYIKVLFSENSENKNIAIYIALIISAGTLATFGFEIVFDAVDLMIFVVTGVNVAALIIFAKEKWKKYRLPEYADDQSPPSKSSAS